MSNGDRDKLARAAIDHALRALVAERQDELDTATKALAEARGRLRAWRRHGQLDRLVAFRAMSIAQIDDLADTAGAPGRHLEALQSYLGEHHPPATQSATPTSEDAAAPETPAS